MADTSCKMCTLCEGDTVFDAAVMMANHRHTAVVIVKGGKHLSGIFTERDVMTRAVCKSLDPRSTKLTNKIFTPDPAYVFDDTTPADALKKMQDFNFRHMPVLDKSGNVKALLDILSVTYDSILAHEETSALWRWRVVNYLNFMGTKSGVEFQNSVQGIVQENVVGSLTLSITETVLDAATKMRDNHITAVLVVTQSGRLAGIFTERDLLTKVVAKGRLPEETPLHEVMTANPATITPDTSPREALGIMYNGRFRHLPVMRGDKIVGMLDVLKLLTDGIVSKDKRAATKGLFSKIGGAIASIFTQADPETDVEDEIEEGFESSAPRAAGGWESPVVEAEGEWVEEGTEGEWAEEALGEVVVEDEELVVPEEDDEEQYQPPPQMQMPLRPRSVSRIPSPSPGPGGRRGSVQSTVTAFSTTISESYFFKFSFRGANFRIYSSGESFADLERLIRQRVKLDASTPLTVAYEDDEHDTIQLSCDSELRDAIHLTRELNLRCIRLTVTSADAEVVATPVTAAPVPKEPEVPAEPAEDPAFADANKKEAQGNQKSVLGDHRAAGALFGAALASLPASCPADRRVKLLSKQGQMLSLSGDSVAASEAFEEAMRVGKESGMDGVFLGVASLGVAQGHLENGRYEAAGKAVASISERSAVEEFVMRMRDEQESFKAEGTACFKSEEYASALQKYTTAIRINRALLDGVRGIALDAPVEIDHTLLSNRAACYQKMSDDESAVKDCEECLRVAPDFLKGYTRLGASLAVLKRYDEAEATLQKGLMLDPGNTAIVKEIERVRELKPKAAVPTPTASALAPAAATEAPPAALQDQMAMLAKMMAAMNAGATQATTTPAAPAEAENKENEGASELNVPAPVAEATPASPVKDAAAAASPVKPAPGAAAKKSRRGKKGKA